MYTLGYFLKILWPKIECIWDVLAQEQHATAKVALVVDAMVQQLLECGYLNGTESY